MGVTQLAMLLCGGLVVLATTALCLLDTFASPIGSDAVSMPIDLSIAQQFELERFNRVIDASVDPAELQELAKQLLQAWHMQKAATNWAISQQSSACTTFQQAGDE
jgi:hypothetical protein